MKRIVETLLEEGIDESMVHRILDLIEEDYEIIDEVSPAYTKAKVDGGENKLEEIKDIAKKNPTEENLKAVSKYEHKLNVTKDHVENYHANKADKEYKNYRAELEAKKARKEAENK